MTLLSYLPKKTIIIIFLLFVNKAFAQRKITLQEAINIATQNNLQIKQALVNISNTNLDLLQSKKNLSPTLNSSTSSNINFARTINPVTNIINPQTSYTFNSQVAANVLLFQGFEKIEEIKRNKSLLEASKNNVQKQRNDLKIQVISLYLNILTLQDQLIAVNQQNALATQLFDNDVKAFLVGKKMQADTSRDRSQILKTTVDRVTIVNQLSNALVEFHQLLDIQANTELILLKPEDEIKDLEKANLNDIYINAIKIMPEIKEEEYTLMAAKQALQIAKSGYYPSLSLSGVVASNYLHQLQQSNSLFPISEQPFLHQLRTNLYEYVYLSLNIPILNNFHNKIAVSKARLNLDNEITQFSIVKNNLYKIINQSVADLNAAKQNYFLYKQSFQAACETYRVIEKRYKGGLSNSLDLNQAQSEMNTAEFTLIKSKYDLIFKSKVIEFYLGKDLVY